MCVPNCAEGKGLLEAATQPSAGSLVRQAFLEHIKNCPECNCPHPEQSNLLSSSSSSSIATSINPQVH
jgi:hypothetical protein